MQAILPIIQNALQDFTVESEVVTLNESHISFSVESVVHVAVQKVFIVKKITNIFGTLEKRYPISESVIVRHFCARGGES